jgi:hypothetical protein
VRDREAVESLVRRGLVEPLRHLTTIARQAQASPEHGQLIQGAAGPEVAGKQNHTVCLPRASPSPSRCYAFCSQVANLLLVCHTYLDDMEAALGQLAHSHEPQAAPGSVK